MMVVVVVVVVIMIMMTTTIINEEIMWVMMMMMMMFMIMVMMMMMPGSLWTNWETILKARFWTPFSRTPSRAFLDVARSIKVNDRHLQTEKDNNHWCSLSFKKTCLINYFKPGISASRTMIVLMLVIETTVIVSYLTKNFSRNFFPLDTKACRNCLYFHV